MRGRGQLIVGGLLIFWGLLVLLDNLTGIDFGELFWPILLIGIGLWIVFRPRMVGPETDVGMRFLGDIRMMGDWQVKEVEYWSFIGDIKLDFSEAQVPAGETKIQVFGFIGDLKLRVPEDIGLAISNMGFITESRLFGRKVGGLFSPVDWKSEGYETAEKKVNIDMINFIGGVRASRP